MNQTKYFNWLSSLVDTDGRGDNYMFLIENLHDIVFSEDTAKLIPNDINRIEDGYSLREKYCHRYHVKATDFIFEEPCTFLEFLIGLSMRIESQFGIKNCSDWFWELIGNLELTRFDDSRYDSIDCVSDIQQIVDIFLQRKYSKDGNGGLFPLQYPSHDQRTREIWYQLNEYLDENYS